MPTVTNARQADYAGLGDLDKDERAERVIEKDWFFIGGRWLPPADPSAQRLTVISPSTEEVIGSVPGATTDDIDAAVIAARLAFDEGPWPQMPRTERIATLRRLADELGKRADDGGRLLTAEMGAPITRGSARNSARYVAAMADLYARQPGSELRSGPVTAAVVDRVPVGVVGVIVPWNGPLFLALAHMAPALLTGCTVVAKPAEETPLSGYLLAEAIAAAGFPDGVVSIVPGDRRVGEHLVRHPYVDKVGFTGSTAAGRRIAAICGEQLKQVSLELGGKSAALVLDDADVDTVVRVMHIGAFNNSGQACNGLTRLVVPEERYEEITEAVVKDVSAIRVGDPYDPTTEVGPLISEAQRTRVEAYIDSGLRSGARLATGGGRPAGLRRGYFLEPTVFLDVDNSSPIGQEEIFGPVLSVVKYSGGDDEAIRIANDSEYGLHGAVFTQTPKRGLEVARQVRAGTFSINGYLTNTAAPFGGVKASGMGRQHGPEAFEAYVNYKTISLLDGRVPPGI
jgi:aldehyde dehydrogenase (NAD+)